MTKGVLVVTVFWLCPDTVLSLISDNEAMLACLDVACFGPPLFGKVEAGLGSGVLVLALTDERIKPGLLLGTLFCSTVGSGGARTTSIAF